MVMCYCNASVPWCIVVMHHHRDALWCIITVMYHRYDVSTWCIQSVIRNWLYVTFYWYGACMMCWDTVWWMLMMNVDEWMNDCWWMNDECWWMKGEWMMNADGWMMNEYECWCMLMNVRCMLNDVWCIYDVWCIDVCWIGECVSNVCISFVIIIIYCIGFVIVLMYWF